MEGLSARARDVPTSLHGAQRSAVVSQTGVVLRRSIARANRRRARDVARPAGIEPAAPSLGNSCSNRLSYGRGGGIVAVLVGPCNRRNEHRDGPFTIHIGPIRYIMSS